MTAGAIAEHVETLATTGGLLPVKAADGQETYNLCLAHYKSVHCQTWLDAARAPRSGPFENDVYIWGVDAGPDNIGMIRMVRHDLAAAPAVMFMVCFCLAHQTHLIVKDLLDTMES